ncbi:MAG: NADH-quinone oxidoreductase subunit N [Meiothermus sp.]|nr:NADH-quinone oxidoreductase subunit N [Meiothermus sp.]
MLTLITLAAFSTVLSLLAFVVSREANRWITVLGLTLAAIFLVVGWGQTETAFNGMYTLDTMGRALTLISILGGLWALLLGPAKKFEFPLLIIYAVAGMHVMASTPNIVVLLIALEVFSLPLYVLATWQRDNKGFEAGLKYFLLGAVAAAMFLYGIALYYGATGTFNAGAEGSGALYTAGLMLMLAALSFKVALVPFQWWTPDVYQGSPTVVTLFMATAVKAAAFAAMLRIFTPQGIEAWGIGLAVLIALTTIFGNLGALAQTEAKRLFAYSSIANAGYIALGLYGPTGQASVPFYLLTYGLGTGIIFAVLAMLSNQDVPLERLKGLWYRKPLMAGAMGLSILSLLGLPPLAGFWGKYLVFQEAAQAGYYALVVLALVTSAISAYYYLKTFFLLFSKSTDHNEAEDREGELATSRFGSSEAVDNAAAAPMGLSGALMVPAAKASTGALGILWSALVLLGLLSLLPGLGLSAFSVGLPAVAAAPQLRATPQPVFATPQAGAEVSGAGFELRGTYQPNQAVEVFEDGVSIGRSTPDARGVWTLQAPPPQSQNPVYEVRAVGQALGSSPLARVSLRVAAASGAACTAAFSLANLQDGATLSRPFRFGGVGSASSYTVTVKRGERVVGTKPLPLNASCGWGYLSNPGVGPVTYELRETGAAADSPPLRVINLVVQ